MKSTTIAALTALLSTGALAVPASGHGHLHVGRHAHLHNNKRDIVWITEFEVETVTVMKTVYGDGSEPTDSPDTVSAAETPAPVTFTSYAVPTSSAAPTTSKAPVPTTTTTTTSAPAAYSPPASSSQAPAPSTTLVSSYVPPAPVAETTTTAPAYQVPSKAATQPAPASSSAAASPPASYGGGSGNCASPDSTTYITTAGSCNVAGLTNYTPGPGSCGGINTDADHVVAMSAKIMLATWTGNPNYNPLCGRKITITGNDGHAYPATVVDTCPGCKGNNGLDLPKPFFDLVTSTADGVGWNITWTWN